MHRCRGRLCRCWCRHRVRGRQALRLATMNLLAVPAVAPTGADGGCRPARGRRCLPQVRRPMRSVAEQLERVLADRQSPRPGAGGDLRGAGPAVRRGGGRLRGAAGLRPGRRRRLRRALGGRGDRRRGSPGGAARSSARSRPGRATPHRLQPTPDGVRGHRCGRCRRSPTPWCPRSHTQGGGARVSVIKPVESGQFVRRTGEDVQPGDVAVRLGAFIGSAQVGSAGRGRPGQGAGAPPAPAVDRLGR